MAQDKTETHENPKQGFHFDIKSVVQGVTNAFGSGREPDASQKTSGTDSELSHHREQAPTFEEGQVGDSLDTSGMPAFKPSSVGFGPFDEPVYSGHRQDASDASAPIHHSDQNETERQFGQEHGKSDDMTLQRVMRKYMKKLWVKVALGMFGVLLAVLVIYQLYLRVYTHIQTETATITTYSETIDTEGIAIRDETAIGGTVNDSSVSAVKNGAKVLKGQPVINIFSSSKAAAAYERIDEIDRQIQELESMVTASEDSANAVKNIENLLGEQMAVLSGYDGKADMSRLGDVKGEVSYLLSKRLVAMRKVENYQDRIDALTREKESLEASYSQQPATVNAPSSGYYVNSLDGYENLLNTSMLNGLTVDKLTQIMSQKVSVPETSAGKLLKDFTWYLACPVPAEEAKDHLVVGTPYTLLLPYSQTGSLRATLTHLNEGDGKKVLAIFQCTSLVSELCEMRSQPVKIQIHSYKGFLLKKSALHVRVREMEEHDENGKLLYTYEARYPCVYTKVGSQLYYKRVDILYNNDKFVICNSDSEQGSGYLALYDEVVTEGKGLYAGKIID